MSPIVTMSTRLALLGKPDGGRTTVENVELAKPIGFYFGFLTWNFWKAGQIVGICGSLQDCLSV